MLPAVNMKRKARYSESNAAIVTCMRKDSLLRTGVETPGVPPWQLHAWPTSVSSRGSSERFRDEIYVGS
jgi:hypothetical protein